MNLIAPAGTPLLSIAALGDVGIVGSGRARARREGADAAFAACATALRAADLAFANLEFPVADEPDVRPGRSREFRHDADVCAALVRAGVRVVALANNHMMDCGPAGLRRTLEACATAGLVAVGAGEDLARASAPARLEVRGRRVVLLAYSQAAADDVATDTRPGVAPLDPERIEADIARWRPDTDVLVVSAHWGSMYVDVPHPRVTALARRIAAAGADVVIGHHPHVLQGAERIGRTLVLYSLGDGVFNCKAGDFEATVASATRAQSGVLTVRIASEAHGLEIAPHALDPDGFAAPVDAAAAEAIAARLRALGAGLADGSADFAAQSAPKLLQYELQSVGQYLRKGRLDKVARLLLSIRPRHLPLLWQALTRSRGRR